MDGQNKTPVGGAAGVLDPTDMTHTPPPVGEMANASTELHAPVYTPPVSLPAPEPSPGYSHGYGYTPTALPIGAQKKSSGAVIALIIIGVGVLLVLGLAAVVAVLAPTSGIFGGGTSAGPVVTQPVRVAVGGATTATANLAMGAGNLNVNPLPAGSGNLLEGNFYYDVPQWKPEVKYNVTDGTGRLTVSQPSVDVKDLKSKRYDWNLGLNSEVPINLRATTGAGNNDLKLSGLNLNSLTVGTGAGNTTVNLEGNWPQSFSAAITTGAGKTTLRLPSQVGVQVTVNNGMGQVTANGFTVKGNVYTNPAYGSSPVTLRINISTGVGETRLELGK